MTSCKVMFFGSGKFGLPTLEFIKDNYEIVGVVSQPDRPAGRNREITATPVSDWARKNKLPLACPERISDFSKNDFLKNKADIWVVIAYGQKIPVELIENQFAINLHGSLLPKWRGAAPIQRAIIEGEKKLGVSVIRLSEKIDCGDILEIETIEIKKDQNSEEVEKDLASLGPKVIKKVIDKFLLGNLTFLKQDDSISSYARKLTKDESRIDFNQNCDLVRSVVNGLNPWPSVLVKIISYETKEVICLAKICRVTDKKNFKESLGTLSLDGVIACKFGGVEILEIQPLGKKKMKWNDFANGRNLPTRMCISS